VVGNEGVYAHASDGVCDLRAFSWSLPNAVGNNHVSVVSVVSEPSDQFEMLLAADSTWQNCCSGSDDTDRRNCSWGCANFSRIIAHDQQTTAAHRDY